MEIDRGSCLDWIRVAPDGVLEIGRIPRGGGHTVMKSLPRNTRVTPSISNSDVASMERSPLAREAKSANAALADMQKAWADEGRDPATLYASAVGGGCVIKDGESADSPRVRALVRELGIELIRYQDL